MKLLFALGVTAMLSACAAGTYTDEEKALLNLVLSEKAVSLCQANTHSVDCQKAVAVGSILTQVALRKVNPVE